MLPKQTNEKEKSKPFYESESESEIEVAQSCPTLCNPMDCSPPGSSLHGVLQARVLLSFSIKET